MADKVVMLLMISCKPLADIQDVRIGVNRDARRRERSGPSGH
jgi:hypothetical protein